VEERIRVVIAGPGADGEDRTAEILARVLRDAGMEVVYTDRPHAPVQLIATVVQEDADAVGLTLPPGADPAPLAHLAGLLSERGIEDVLVFGSSSSSGTAPSEVAGWLRERLSG
jgi:methylmalonyl-CoA mutase C-terminal domain/subunit